MQGSSVTGAVSRRSSWLVWFLLAVLLSGCASHADRMTEATTLMRHGEFAAAEERAAAALEGERQRLLRLMEVGVLRHLQGDYLGSNQLLDEADYLADELFTTSTMDLLNRLSTNATRVTYRGMLYERVYIHYYKTMNFLFLAEQAGSRAELERYLDAARIEGRRAQLLLDENLHRTGDYAEAEEEEGRLLNQIMDLYASLNGEVINPRELVFRDNAFTHYLIGSLYERYGELDNARISYERAARTYEQGYARQYDLGEAMTAQAWFDVARILKTQRDTRWQRVAREKLSAEQRRALDQWNPRTGSQLLVIQEVDMMSPRGELNLMMTLQPDTNRLFIRPLTVGTEDQRAYQLAWFYYLYADKGLLNVIERIRADDYIGLLTMPHEKTIGVGPLRSTLDQLGLTEILASTGVRLTVPLFYYYEPPLHSSRLTLTAAQGQAQTQALLDADNLAGLAMAQHLVDAQSELTQAMAIESLRLALCVQTGVPGSLCALTAAATASADTRLWITLPNRIRITRQLLAPGEYELKLRSEAEGFSVEETHAMTLNPGQLHIWRARTFAENPQAAVPDLVTQARAARLANETLVELYEDVEDENTVDESH